MAEVFKALGDPTRLNIISLLSSSNNLCVNIIASKLSMSQPSISQHLKVLKNAGICRAHKIGAHVHYSLNTEKMEEYKKYFDNLLNGKPCNDCTECPENIRNRPG
jgi:ArsR family transcriptional regulator